jgi:TonB family protein
MPGLSLQNLLAWTAQIAVIIAVGGILPKLLRLRDPRSYLTYCYFLLTACLALPFIQPWAFPAIDNAIGTNGISSVSLLPGSIALLNPFWSQAIVWILLVGILVRLGLFMAGLYRIRRYRTSAIPHQFPRESVLSTCQLIEPAVSVGVSAMEVGPVTFGWRHPMILLPGSFLSLDEEAQRAILCHEFLHVLRRDWLTTIIEELIGACLWFHPAIWWLLSQTRLAREQFIDAEVVRMTTAREPYIEALLTMAGAHPDRGLTPAPLFLSRRHLAARMRALLIDHPISRARLRFSYVFVAAALSAAAWIAFATFPLMASSTRQEIPVTVELKPADTTAGEPQVEAYTIGDGVSAPILKSHVHPTYSDAARTARIQGIVLLEGVVETDGTLTNIRVARSLDPDLDRNAVAALKQWRFEPGKRDGLAVPVKLAIEVNFNLK